MMRKEAMNGFWNGKKVLVTGHTGFKGAWLSLWLERLGARVTGIALPPTTFPNLYSMLGLWEMQDHHEADVTNSEAISGIIRRAQPEIVFHMAAQALVRPSYDDPLLTYSTNVMGTANVLNALRDVRGLKAVVVITTDKVYESTSHGHASVETDRLGGFDPYSSSKACTEILVSSFRDSFFAEGARLATARAGNVVGGGDWSKDRLVPDIIKSHLEGRSVKLRYPNAVRPWQHVLAPLNGYLMYAQRLCNASTDIPLALNFGPDDHSPITVSQIVEILAPALGTTGEWNDMEGPHPIESPTLLLNSSLARHVLGWRPHLDTLSTFKWTADWYQKWRQGNDPRKTTLEQLNRYETLIPQNAD